MNYKEFLSSVEDTMRSRFGSAYSLSVQSVLRNNGTSYDGLIIFHPEMNISPTIYLNPYYHRYLDGISLKDICEDIYASYISSLPGRPFDTDFFTDYERVRSHLTMKLISRERNEELLSDLPYLPVLDLAMVFMVLIDDDELGCGNVLVHKEHAKLWNRSPEQLYCQAMTNCFRLQPPCCRKLEELMLDMVNEAAAEGIPDMGMPSFSPGETSFPIRVLTNQAKVYGAACILYPGLLASLAQKVESDLILLPSSVHEFLLIDAVDDACLDGFSYMVREVNETEVADDEILSDHAYYYDRREGRIYMPGREDFYQLMV